MLTEFFYGWLIVALLFFIMEMGSPGLFFFLSFSAGAVCSAVITIFLSSFMVQLIAFLVGTVAAFIFLRLWVKKYMHPRHVYATNVHALQGKHGYVIKVIGINEPGQVKVNGQIWSARSYNNQIVENGSDIEVIDVKGAHLIIKEFKG